MFMSLYYIYIVYTEKHKHNYIIFKKSIQFLNNDINIKFQIFGITDVHMTIA